LPPSYANDERHILPSIFPCGKIKVSPLLGRGQEVFHMIRTRESRSQEQMHLKDREWVVGYARVSSTRQGSEKGFGLATQKKAIMDYCTAQSLAVSEIYTDIVSGTEASLDERHAYWEMLDYAKKAGIRTVIV